jgi:hypothetical protein
VHQVNRVVARAAADVDVLAENGELLREVTVKIGQMLEARGRINALLAPLLKRMGTAACDGESAA